MYNYEFVNTQLVIKDTSKYNETDLNNNNPAIINNNQVYLDEISKEMNMLRVDSIQNTNIINNLLLDKEECEINVLTIGSTNSCNLDNIKNELSLNLKSINQDDNPANEDETSSQYDEDNLNISSSNGNSLRHDNSTKINTSPNDIQLTPKHNDEENLKKTPLNLCLNDFESKAIMKMPMVRFILIFILLSICLVIIKFLYSIQILIRISILNNINNITIHLQKHFLNQFLAVYVHSLTYCQQNLILTRIKKKQEMILKFHLKN